MPRSDLAHPDDAPGDWFVDTRCIRCDAARHWAPGLIGTDTAGRSFVARQPVTPDDTAAMWRAAEACPTRSIGSRQPANGPPARAPDGVFPHPLAPDVLALGRTPGRGGRMRLITGTRACRHLTRHSGLPVIPAQAGIQRRWTQFCPIPSRLRDSGRRRNDDNHAGSARPRQMSTRPGQEQWLCATTTPSPA